jgi:hypothetical protein
VAGGAVVALILVIVLSEWLIDRDENGVSVSDCIDVRVAYGQPREAAKLDCTRSMKR